MVLAYSGLLNVATLATLRAGSPIFNALAGYDAKFLGGWAIVAALALLRLRRTAALAATALLLWLVYSIADAPNWSYIDAPSMRSLTVAGLEIAALVASPGPRRAMQIINWRHYTLALALPVYYLIATFLVPPSMTGGRYEVTSGWEGPLRVTVTCAPFAVLLCVALVVALRSVQHAPVDSREA